MTSHSGRDTASILPSASHAPALGRRFGSNMMVRAQMPKATAGSCMLNGTKTPQLVSNRHKAPHPAAI